MQRNALDTVAKVPEIIFNTSLCITPFKQQLLKWIGNKQRFADEIISYFPDHFGTYFEPFLGSGAVLGVLAPNVAVASDTFSPLMEIWDVLKDDPALLEEWYSSRWKLLETMPKKKTYELVKERYNKFPNGADFLFLSRACYGGVVRFRKNDGYMSTPCGAHKPIPPESFKLRVKEWHKRISGTDFYNIDYTEAMDMAKTGDLVYCDPPYSHSQAILYGAQSFDLAELMKKIQQCKSRGVYVALSIDGSKKSGDRVCDVPIPKGLFLREIAVNCGRSMLKRFQMEGKTLEKEMVTDRLLLTY